MKELEKNLEATGGVPAEAELAAINRFAKSPLRAEEVYTFSLRLCDNEVDRDWERFDTAALNTLGDLFVGKSGIFDHQWTAEGQTARIYRTEMVREGAQVTAVGDGYCWLKAWAYLLRTEKNADLIAEIEGGIKREVSVGCSVARRVCSICGAEGGTCQHTPGQRYGEQLCYLELPGSHRRIRVVLRGGASPAEGGGPEAVRPREPGDGTAEGPGGAGAEIPAGAAAGGDAACHAGGRQHGRRRPGQGGGASGGAGAAGAEAGLRGPGSPPVPACAAAAEPGSGKNRGRDRISDLREDEA